MIVAKLIKSNVMLSAVESIQQEIYAFVTNSPEDKHAAKAGLSIFEALRNTGKLDEDLTVLVCQQAYQQYELGESFLNSFYVEAWKFGQDSICQHLSSEGAIVPAFQLSDSTCFDEYV